MAQRDRRRGPRVPDLASDSGRGSMVVMESALKVARLKAGLTQEELALRANVSQETVSKTEQRIGHYGNLSLTVAGALADALGTTVDALFPRTGGAR